MLVLTLKKYKNSTEGMGTGKNSGSGSKKVQLRSVYCIIKSTGLRRQEYGVLKVNSDVAVKVEEVSVRILSHKGY